MSELSRVENVEISARTGVSIKSITTTVVTCQEVTIIAPEFFKTGTKFKCELQGTVVKGRLNTDYRSDIVLLCQNKISGYNSGKLPEFKYSWSLRVTKDAKTGGYLFTDDEVFKFELELDPEYKVPFSTEFRTVVGSYDAVLTSEQAEVGCQTIPFERVKEVYEKMTELRELEQKGETE